MVLCLSLSPSSTDIEQWVQEEYQIDLQRKTKWNLERKEEKNKHWILVVQRQEEKHLEVKEKIEVETRKQIGLAIRVWQRGCYGQQHGRRKW